MRSRLWGSRSARSRHCAAALELTSITLGYSSTELLDHTTRANVVYQVGSRKVTRTDGNKQTVVWVVDGLPAPARILQRKDGQDEMDLQLKAMR